LQRRVVIFDGSVSLLQADVCTVDVYTLFLFFNFKQQRSSEHGEQISGSFSGEES
jgi:hypothetical protein